MEGAEGVVFEGIVEIIIEGRVVKQVTDEWMVFDAIDEGAVINGEVEATTEGVEWVVKGMSVAGVIWSDKRREMWRKSIVEIECDKNE